MMDKNQKIPQKKLLQYEEILELLELGENAEKCRIASQNDTWEYRLWDLATKIADKLESVIPKITRENSVIFIKDEKYMRALTLFLAYFQDYLPPEIIALLEDSVDIHLQKLYQIFKRDNKDIVEGMSKSVGITIIGYTDDNKHIGDIDLKLQAQGVKIVYLCNSMRAYGNLKRRIENFDCLILVSHPMYYANISRVKVLLSTNTPLPLQKMKNVQTKIIHLGHNFNEALQYSLWRTDKDYVFKSLKRERLDRCHYVVAHTENDYRVLQKACEYFDIDEARILKGGNPSLDWTLQKYKENAGLKDGDKKYLLLAPSYLRNFLEDLQMVAVLEEIMDMGIFLVIRPHPLQLQRDCLKYKEILEQWSGKYHNFKIDDSGKYFNEYLINSFTLLTDESSMGISYPFYTLSPSVIYIKEPRKRGVEVDGIGLYNKTTNILVENFDELKNNIVKLSGGGGGLVSEIKKNISIFRNKQTYHLMESSQYLADVIKGML